MTRPRKKSRRKRESNPRASTLEADALPVGQRGGRNKGEQTGTVKVHNETAMRGKGGQFGYLFFFFLFFYKIAKELHVHAHERAHARAHTHAHTHARTHTRAHTRAHTHTHTLTHTLTRACVLKQHTASRLGETLYLW